MIRRHALQKIAALGSALWGAGQSGAVACAAVPASRVHVRLGYVGYPCEAATFMAPGSRIFRRHGLEPHLVAYTTEAALLAALGSGTVDAASMRLATLLGPLESGVDVSVVAGLHAGCLRVLEREILSFRDLKGKTIATDRLHGPAMNLLSAIMHRQGVDPAREVIWKAYSERDLESALDANEVSYVTASDPYGYVLLSSYKAAEAYLGNAGGNFSCGTDIASAHHCFLVLGRQVVQKRPVAAALTRSFLDATAALGRGARPDAAAANPDSPVASDMQATLAMLSSYTWNASTAVVLEELELTARDFRRAGLLRRSTDPEQLAVRAFVDILGADAN